MSTLHFNNVSLYIKRVELHLTSNFIITIFNQNNIGIVREVKFIKKTDNSGKEYNGAIVVFERWFTNSKVDKLLNDINNSDDGTTKFTYDNYGHYWYINIYTTCIIPETQQVAMVDSKLPDNQRIIALENLLQNMTTQLTYMQTRNEYNERLMVEYEQKQTRHYLSNVEIRSLLEDKQFELDNTINEYEYKLKTQYDELTVLKTKLACLCIDLVRKEEECELLKQELNDQNCIINYLESNNDTNMEISIDLPNIAAMTLDELN